MSRDMMRNGNFNIPKCRQCNKSVAYYMLEEKKRGSEIILVCSECASRVRPFVAPTALVGE